MRIKAFRAIIGALAVGMMVAAIQPASATEKIRLAITSYGFAYLPVLTAVELGLFEREGVEVEVIMTGGGAKAGAALIGGSVEIYGGNAAFALQAHAKGTGVVIVGACMTEYATNIVVQRSWAERHGITDASSYRDRLNALKGLTIGVLSRGSGHEHLVRFLAKEAGINADQEMSIQALGVAEAMSAAFAHQRIDAFVHSAPVGERAIKDHDAVMFFNMSKAIVEPLAGFLYISYIAREDWLRENGDTMVRFLRGAQGALDIIHDPIRSASAREAIRSKYYPKLDAEFFEFVWNENVAAFPRSVAVTEGMIRQALDFQNEFSREAIPESVLRTGWTNEYAQRATANAAN